MSRLRTDLKPMEPARRSPTKFPPVRGRWSLNSPTCSTHSRDPDWSTDMIRGIQLRTVSKGPVLPINSPKKTPLNEPNKTQPSQVHQEEKRSSTPQRNDQEKDKEIEKLKLKIASLQKLIEQLRAEIKEKTCTITELEEKLLAQENDFGEKLKLLNVTISEKEKEIEEQKKFLQLKIHEINGLNERFRNEKEEMKKQFDQNLVELKTQHLNELAARDEKMRILKMHMADSLKDNSKERQQQLEELTKELKRVTEETDLLKSKLQSMKSSHQGKCQNCFVMERQLQSKIVELRDKEVMSLELKQLCAKMERQLVQQDELLRQWAKNQEKTVR